MAKLAVLFIVVPLLELYLLLLLGSVIGFWPTVAIVLVTGMLGAWLAKREGLRVFRKWQAALAEGRMPEEGVLGGLLVLIGGVLLVAPGVITDLTGLVLLLPPTRKLVAARVRAHFERKVRDGSVRVTAFRAVDLGATAPPRRSGDVIDVEGEVVDADEPGASGSYLTEPGR